MKKCSLVITVLFLLALLITGCGHVTPVPTPTQEPVSTGTLQPTTRIDAQQYLSEALDIIQNNALNSKKVDWEETRLAAFTLVKDARIPAQTYDTIRYVLEQLGDHHSAFVTPDVAKQMKNSTIENFPQPKGKLLDNKIGYVAVFEFNAQAADQVNKYADEIQSL